MKRTKIKEQDIEIASEIPKAQPIVQVESETQMMSIYDAYRSGKITNEAYRKWFTSGYNVRTVMINV